MKKVIINFILCRIFYYLNKDRYVLQFETSRYNQKSIEEYLKNKGFVVRNSGWLCKGFVYIRFLDDCLEIKTISEYNQSKSIYISTNKWSVENYLKYLTKLL